MSSNNSLPRPCEGDRARGARGQHHRQVQGGGQGQRGFRTGDDDDDDDDGDDDDDDDDDTDDTDDDDNDDDQVVYSLAAGQDQGIYTHFAVATGQAGEGLLKLVTELDFESASLYQVMVMMDDDNNNDNYQ